jgi:hypothetical protein
MAVMKEAAMNWMDLPELISGLFQGWTHRCTVTVPKRCGLCGTPSAGNWFTGYYLPCINEVEKHACLLKESGIKPLFVIPPHGTLELELCFTIQPPSAALRPLPDSERP